MAEGKKSTLGRQDSGVFSNDATPLTPQQQPLGGQHVGASSVSPLSPIAESDAPSHPNLDTHQLQQSLHQLSLEKNEDEEDDVQFAGESGHHHAQLQRCSSEGDSITFLSRTRPTNLIPNQIGNIPPLRRRGSTGKTETLTPSRRTEWLALMSDEKLYTEHADLLRQEVDRIVQRLVSEDPSDSLSQIPHGADSRVSKIETENCLEGFVASGGSSGSSSSGNSSYPQQQILFPLNQEHISVGCDGYYYNRRDYIQSEEEVLGEGGFGRVMACQDLKCQKMFAMKSNNRCTQDKVESIKRECALLHDIGEHEYITQFLGAVMENESATCSLQQSVLKMLMEIAENGNLNEMLTDPDTGDTMGLPLDQSLFYLQQILYGVHYLHQRNILHLDLKCKNILVFNDGRRVKLADFGAAMKMNELEAQEIHIINEYTPNFAAPEVVSNCFPSYSADVWSVMCVFVEMITGKLPWCYKEEVPQHCLIYWIGKYSDEQVERIVPYKALQLDQNVVDMLLAVFIKNSAGRPTALDLLRHELICDAHEYEKFFDPLYEEPPVESTAQFDEQTKPPTESTLDTLASIPHKVSVDSGRDSPDTAERSDSISSSIFSSCAVSPGSVENKVVQRTESSLHPHRRLSAPNFTPKLASCIGNNATGKGRPSSATTASPLIHSNSAPMAVGRRRHTVSMSLPLYCQDDVESDGIFYGRKQKLKRTSSENYVSNGPDVDSPEAARTAILNGLLKSSPTSCQPASLSDSPSRTNKGGDLVSQGTQTGTSPRTSPATSPKQPQSVSPPSNPAGKPHKETSQQSQVTSSMKQKHKTITCVQNQRKSCNGAGESDSTVATKITNCTSIVPTSLSVLLYILIELLRTMV